MAKIQIETEVDDCLADEIRDLNNVHGVCTISSCCGHTIKENASITIFNELDRDKMIKLGYERLRPLGIEYYMSFKPKSKCKCTSADKSEPDQLYIPINKESFNHNNDSFIVNFEGDVRSFTLKEFLTKLGFLPPEGGK